MLDWAIAVEGAAFLLILLNYLIDLLLESFRMLAVAVFIVCNYQLSIIMIRVNKSLSVCALFGACTGFFSGVLPAIAEKRNEDKVMESIAAISCDQVQLGYETYEELGRLVDCKDISEFALQGPLGTPMRFVAFEQEDGSVRVYAMDALGGVLSTRSMSKAAWVAKQARDSAQAQGANHSENETDTATEPEAFDNESCDPAPAQKYGRYGRIVETKTRLDPFAVTMTRFLRDDGLVTQIVTDATGQPFDMHTRHEEFPLACDWIKGFFKHHALSGRVFEYKNTLTCGSEGLGTLKLFFKPFLVDSVDAGKAASQYSLLVGVEALDEMPSSWPKRLVTCNLNCDMVHEDSFFYAGEGTQSCKGSCADTPIGAIHFSYLRDGEGKLVMRDVDVVSASDDNGCL